MDLVEERDTKVCVKALYKYIMLELKTDEDALIGADFILKIGWWNFAPLKYKM